MHDLMISAMLWDARGCAGNRFTHLWKISQTIAENHKRKLSLIASLSLLLFYSRKPKMIQAFFALSQNFFHGSHPGQRISTHDQRWPAENDRLKQAFNCLTMRYQDKRLVMRCLSRLSSRLPLPLVSSLSRHAGHGKRCVSSWQADVSSGWFKQAFVSVFMWTVFMWVLFGRTCFKQAFALVFGRTGGRGSRVRVATQIAIE